MALDINKLAVSWTKYSVVQLIDVISSTEEINKYLSGEKTIDEPVLKKFLGIRNLTDEIPSIWTEIQKYPKQKRLFALIAALYTHHENITNFADKYANKNMGGIFLMQSGKQYTNIRSALVVSGASPTSFRRKEEVPYNLSPLYENGEVGKLFKKLLEQRLVSIGWDGNNFYGVANEFKFAKALSLSSDEFQKWLEGESLVTSNLVQNLDNLKKFQETRGIKINQWLDEWNEINFSEEEMRRKPEPFSIMFKMDARLLKRLSDVHRRKADSERKSDTAIQRPLNETRSQEISNYIHGGFPWSTISDTQRASEEYKDLRMPGILPTAIIANILAPGTERGNHTLDLNDSISLEDMGTDFPKIKIPDHVFEESWDPDLKPLEIIDGQHRLWAFDEEEELKGNFELPVIAYVNLDRAWQAYLFYTINIKPVKINTSLGFDLYPLLRTQKWLEPLNDGLAFYRENRAQELVEALWIYRESPWKDRIKMLGEGDGNISQAAFVNALTTSYLKKPSSRTIGGLFSTLIIDGNKNKVLNWNRSQQAGFLILIWDLISESLAEFLTDKKTEQSEYAWAKSLRISEINPIDGIHPAFTSKNSFLSRDQGVRGISMFTNDFFFFLASDEGWNLNELSWDEDLDEREIRFSSIDKSISDIKKHRIYDIIKALSYEIIKMDWRTGSANFDDNPDQILKQQSYKGSSGYTNVWKELVGIAANSNNAEIAKYAGRIQEFLK